MTRRTPRPAWRKRAPCSRSSVSTRSTPAWQAGDAGGRLREVVDALVALALRQREAARARGDYASADSIRDTLEASGVVVEDTPEGTRWELAR